MNISYHPDVEVELAEIRDYYEEKLTGLGIEFLNEFERNVFKIASMPSRYMVVRGDVRRSLMKRFPYVIYFKVVSEDAILVTVVKHERRHPSYGTNRD